jgi:sugar transferase (PEP-CTERM/EpsH1 system associated)
MNGAGGSSTSIPRPAGSDPRPLVLHVVYRFDVGGLENGLVNLINHMCPDAYRHAVLALTEATDFRHRIRRDGVPVVALNKPPGHAVGIYPQLFRLMRSWRPAVVHSRNLAALEALLPALAAGVRVRIHGEHGRDIDDPYGASRKHQWLRRAYRPFVSHYVALTDELSRYLIDKVGVQRSAITRICNGVDTTRFRPAGADRAALEGCPFSRDSHWLVGTVGRMQAVKDQVTLARAFVMVLARRPSLRDRVRLVMIGDGPLRDRSMAILHGAGVAALAWLPGLRDDIPAIMQGLDCFVLPSIAEGVSNTILEAMASGLPVIATDVGANSELVDHGVTGFIVPPADEQALAAQIVDLASDAGRSAAMGRAGRAAAESRFSLQAMTSAYQSLYDSQLASRRRVQRVPLPRS